MPVTLDEKQWRAHFKKHDPEISAIIKKVGPLRLKSNKQYFVVLVRSIVSQQISVKAADTIYSRFAALFKGRRPNAARILELPDETMREAGLSRQKTVYLKDLARHFNEGLIKPRRFPLLENQEIIDQLIQVKGIGRWTAEMFLMFSLNRLDVLPVDDLGLQAGVQKIYNLKSRPDAKKMRTIGARWHPYESVATWYTWQFLRMLNEEKR